MKLPRPQIRLRGIFLATFWSAVCFAAYGTITQSHIAQTSLSTEVILTWMMMLLPFVAGGALFGRTILGAVIGIVVVGLFWFVWSLT